MPELRAAGGRPPRASREQVVDVGLQILKADGLAAVTLGAIGERLGLGKVALYTYVKSKEDLLVAMRDEVYRRQLLALESESDLAPEVALKGMCTRLVALMQDYGELMVTADDLSGLALEVGERFLDVLARVGLAPRQQLEVYFLLSAIVRSTLALQGQPAPELQREPSDSARYPRLQQLLAEAVTLGDAPLSFLVDDALSLVIDVLIPSLRRS